MAFQPNVGQTLDIGGVQVGVVHAPLVVSAHAVHSPAQQSFRAGRPDPRGVLDLAEPVAGRHGKAQRAGLDDVGFDVDQLAGRVRVFELRNLQAYPSAVVNEEVVRAPVARLAADQ